MLNNFDAQSLVTPRDTLRHPLVTPKEKRYKSRLTQDRCARDTPRHSALHGRARTHKSISIVFFASLARIKRVSQGVAGVASICGAASDFRGCHEWVSRGVTSLIYYYFLLKIKKMIEKYSCGKENAKAFSKKLKETVPEFFPLVKALYQEGLIKGLRGMTLEIGMEGSENGKNGVEAKKSALNCGECLHWRREFEKGQRGRCGLKRKAINIMWADVKACSNSEAMLKPASLK